MSGLKGYEQSLWRDHGPDYLDSRDMEDAGVALYARQGEVPRLPLPSLQETFDTFLDSVRPHVTEAEFAETRRKVLDFGKKGGLAEKLQRRLEALKEERKDSSWLSKFWNDVGYLGYRDSIVWNVSYYLQFLDELRPGMKSQTRRAARFLYHALEYRRMFVEGELQPDMSKDKPMSNTQHKYMFNATRMPGETSDSVRTYAPDVFKHVAVVRKNRFFVFDAIDQATGKRLSVDDLHYQLERVKQMGDQDGAHPYPVGVLSAENRDLWFKKRKMLIRDPQGGKINAKSLEAIESAILVICLDDSSPTTREEVGRALIHGDGRNRFWDKSMQLVFFENGKGGYIGEHSMMDGLTTTRMVNFILEKVFEDPVEIISGANFTNSLLQPPQRLQFRLSHAMKDAINEACRTFDDMVESKELSVCMFHGFGKDQIKKWKMSPDAFAQLAIQYAYYETFGCVRGTYESTQTRTFLHGRTEVTRSVTNESLAFCQAAESGVSLSKCAELMRAATTAHASYTGKALLGYGCDRHLLGLKLVMKPNESADLYSDPGFLRSSTWALSTSGLTGELMDGWGFGEVVPHGIGIGYSVQAKRLRFTVSSRHSDQKWAHHMAANLELALREMAQFAAAELPPKSKL